MFIREIASFRSGLITSVEDRSIPVDATPNQSNWLTRGDRVELRLGSLLVGQRITGSGKVAKVWTAFKIDNTQVLFRQRGQSVEYYTANTDLWTEIGSNILGANGLTESITFANYTSLAGAQVWFGSPNTGLFKVLVANPGSYRSMFASGTNYYGYIAINDARMSLWQKNDDKNKRDPSTLYFSKIDTRTYTTVTNEDFTEPVDGSRVSFTKTLAALSGVRTSFALAIKNDGTVVATDQGDGTLTGSGGSGTVNYVTGAVAFTYTVAPVATARIDYQWEDSNAGGISDFGYTTPVRLAGEGLFLPQPRGGSLMKVDYYEGSYYCHHEKTDYIVTLSADDTNALNVIFREKGGIPSTQASISTGDGIFYVDDTDEQKPYIRLAAYKAISAKVIPVSISNQLDLSNYRFDQAVLFQAGDFIIVACRHKDFTYNQTMFLWNRLWKTWDVLDYFAASLTLYNGALILGDPIQSNTYQAFSGFDDDSSTINNIYDTGWDSDVGAQVGASRTHRIFPGTLKKSKILEVEGYIGPNQTIEFYMATDDGKFGAVIGSINGQDDGVDKSQSVNVGATTIGRFEVGGGSGAGDIPASHYIVQIKLRQDKYEIKKLRWIATGLGYAAVSKIRWRDIRIMGQRLTRRYRTAVT